ncbi:MAG TPA: immunoglobulin domain-containing protein [Gemmataceae bacterium]
MVNSLVGTSPSPPAPPSPPSPPTSTPPSITLNPTSVTVTAGATVSFTAAASGNPTPTVQWEINTNDGTGWHNLSNGGNVSGATTDKLTLTNVGISMSGDKFEAVFSNGVGSPATTSAATLTVTSPPPAPPPVAGLLPDGGFEQPVVGASSRSDPSGSPWTFFWTAGVAGNGSVLTSGNPNAPEGQQVGYLQNRYSMISQAVNLTTGNIYTINFEAAQAVHGQTNNQAIEVFVNDTPVGVITPTSSSYANYNTGSFYVTASGTYVITFVGLDPRSTALLDEVSLSASPMVAQRNQAGARESVALATGASSNGTAGANAAGLPGLSFQQIGLSLHDPLFTQGGANLLQHEIDVLLQPGTLTHTILALQQQAALGPLGALLKPDWLDPFLF